MNKAYIVALLQKDLRELMLLMDGFEDMEQFPEAILTLAEEKSRNITESLISLRNIQTEITESLHIPDEVAISQTVTYLQTTPEVAEEDTSSNNYKSDSRKTQSNEEFQEEVEVEEINEAKPFLSFDSNSYSSAHAAESETSESPAEQVKEPVTINLYPNSISDKLAEEPKNSLSDHIAVQKIDDIRQAISIGDRFRFQRELFDNKGELMNKTIAKLNEMNSYEDAKSYLFKKFGWSEKDEAFEEFFLLIKKRY